MSDYTENKTPNLIINTLEDQSKLSEITVGENEIVLVPDETEEELAKKQDKLVAGTNITLVDDPLTQTTLISSTASESFYKGTYENWSLVPTNGNAYPDTPRGSGNHKPTYTDYIIIQDASTVPGGQVDMSMTMETDTYAQYPNKKLETVIDSNTYNGTGTFYDGNIQVYCDAAGGNYSVHWKTLKSPVEYQGQTYQPGSDFLTLIINSSNNGTRNAQLSLGNPYEGTWRFSYDGVWDTDNRNGWKGEYKVEDTLPIASDTVAGIAKLYTTTGQNTDGSMTQKSITDAINLIQDSCFRGSWNTWNDVPVSANLYPEDYKYSHTPTYNDYMVVNDASGYVPSDLLTVELIVVEMTNSTCRYTIGADSYTKTRQSGQNAPFGPNNEMSWNTQGEGTQGTRITFNDQVKFRDHVYNAGEGITLENESGGYAVKDVPLSFFIKRNVETLTGAWRFSYQGVWETDGKSGWIEEYQIENTLPIASPTVAGITKLYTTTGSNTDGSMDQNSITTALGTKQNTLTAGNNITIDANSKIDAADKTLVSFVIWEDEE